MSSQNVQKYSANPKSPPAGGENEATALPNSLIDNQPPSLQQTLQQQSDWQARLEQLQGLHKQESLQQQKEHLEQLRLLQAQILTELTVTSADHQTSSSKLTSPVSEGTSQQLKTPISSKSRQSLPTSPLSLVKGEDAEEKSKGLARTQSLSNLQLTLAPRTLSPMHRSAIPSPVKVTSPDDTPVPNQWLVRSPSPHTKSPSPSLQSDGEKSQPHQIEKDTSAVEFSIGPSYGFLQADPVYGSTSLVRTSTTESLEQNSKSYNDTTVVTCTSTEASPIKSDGQLTTLEGVLSPNCSPLNLNIPRMSPSSIEGGVSDSVSPPTKRKLVWTELSSQQSNASQESNALSPPSRNIVVKTSPVSQPLITPMPQYPVLQLSPRCGSPYAGNSTHLSPSNTNSWTIATPAAISRAIGSSGSVNKSVHVTESQSRAMLMEKHRKHMDDLKEYYESELSQLQSRLERLEAEKNDPSPTPTTTRRSLSPLSPSFPASQKSPNSPRKPVNQLYFPSSLVKSSRARTPASSGTVDSSSGRGDVSPTPVMAAVVNESELWMLQNENTRLKGECAELHIQVDLGLREKHVLEEQVKRLQEHKLDWKERLEASERMVSVLQERLESTRSQLYDQDKLVGQLRSDLQVAAEELHYWKEQRTQDIEKIEQLFDEFEVLQQENREVRSANSQLQYDLEEAQKKTIAYKTSLDKYQVLESQYKSTIHELEDEVRHLQHVNNRLHSMGTHYQLGSYGSPFNQPDEEKAQVSPRSSSKSRVTHPPSTPQFSNAPPERRDTPSNSATAKVPLTRRKWLESSIPGLIFGGGSEEEEATVTKEQLTTNSVHTGQRARSGVSTSPSRVPAMVNLASEARERKRLSTSPADHASPRPSRDGSVMLSHQKSPMLKAVEKVVLEEASGGKDHRDGRKWYEGGGGGSGDSIQIDLADTALRAVRDGSVIATVESGYSNPEGGKKRSSKTSIEERVKKHMQIVSEAEKKLAALQKEKEKLESGLLKTPRVGTRMTRQTKQTKLEAERRLEEVVKEIGSVRMVLRRHHALKK